MNECKLSCVIGQKDKERLIDLNGEGCFCCGNLSGNLKHWIVKKMDNHRFDLTVVHGEWYGQLIYWSTHRLRKIRLHNSFATYTSVTSIYMANPSYSVDLLVRILFSPHNILENFFRTIHVVKVPLH
jgi:hypothetical protein